MPQNYPIGEWLLYTAFSFVVLSLCLFIMWIFHMIGSKLRPKWTSNWGRAKATVIYATTCLSLGCLAFLLGAGGSTIERKIYDFRENAYRDKLVDQPLSKSHIEFDLKRVSSNRVFAEVVLRALNDPQRSSEVARILPTIYESHSDSKSWRDPRAELLGQLCEAATSTTSPSNSEAWRKIVTACFPIAYPYEKWEKFTDESKTKQWLSWLWEAHVKDKSLLAHVLSGRYIVDHDNRRYDRDVYEWLIGREIHRTANQKMQEIDLEKYVRLDEIISSNPPFNVAYPDTETRGRDLALVLISGGVFNNFDIEKTFLDAKRLRERTYVSNFKNLEQCSTEAELLASSKLAMDSFSNYAKKPSLYRQIALAADKIRTLKRAGETDEEFMSRTNLFADPQFVTAKQEARDKIMEFNSAVVCVRTAAFDQKVKNGQTPIDLPSPSEETQLSKRALARLAFENK